MATDEAGAPPLSRKLAWGGAVALIAAVLLLAGGLEALQGVITIAALPFALLLLGVMVALYRVLDQEHRLEQRRQARARHALQQWIATEPPAPELADEPPTPGTNPGATGRRVACRRPAGRQCEQDRQRVGEGQRVSGPVGSGWPRTQNKT